MIEYILVLVGVSVAITLLLPWPNVYSYGLGSSRSSIPILVLVVVYRFTDHSTKATFVRYTTCMRTNRVLTPMVGRKITKQTRTHTLLMQGMNSKLGSAGAVATRCLVMSYIRHNLGRHMQEKSTRPMYKQNRIGQNSPPARRDKVRSTSDYHLPGLAGETAASPLRQKQKTLR